MEIGAINPAKIKTSLEKEQPIFASMSKRQKFPSPIRLIQIQANAPWRCLSTECSMYFCLFYHFYGLQCMGLQCMGVEAIRFSECRATVADYPI
jgi:hypothetical protein